jgi:hypothetical protein
MDLHTSDIKRTVETLGKEMAISGVVKFCFGISDAIK